MVSQNGLEPRPLNKSQLQLI